MSSKVAISEIAEIIMGQSPKKQDVNEIGDGFPLLNGPTEFNDRYPEPTQFTTAGKRFSKEDDILFCVRGSTTGRMNYADQKYAIGRGIAAIRGKNGYPTLFVRAVIEKNLDRLLVAATGSTFPNVSKSLLNDFEVEVIPTEKAKEVNEILISIEDKIHLNQQTNETLEATVQAIFKSRFVDFDPVRAKIEAGSAGRDPNHAAMAAIAGVSLEQDWDEIEAALNQKLARMSDAQQQQLSRTAQLFPDELVESEIGEVPKGWEVKPFYDIIEIIGGGTPKTKINEYWDGDILWYSVIDTPNESDVFVIDTEKKITKIGLENSSAKLVDTGTTIISARGTVGKLALTPKKMTYNQSCYGLRSKIDCPYFNFYKTKQLVESLKRGSHGSVFDTITQKTFKTVDIAQPPEILERKFDTVVGSLMSKIQKNSEENITLSELRDTLLPKLISGAIDINKTYE